MEILGNYPILNNQISSVDENGIQTLTYIFTVKTVDALDYIPFKDTEYYGPTLSAQQSFLDPRNGPNPSKYKVTETSTSNLPGGLTQISVNTVGTQNIETPPKIKLIPNSPLLFGLSGIISASSSAYNNSLPNYVPNGSAVNGYGVSVTFLTESTVEAEGFVFSNYFNKIMPSAIYGTTLPAPARQPFYMQGEGARSTYNGFICTDNNYQRIGGITLFNLIYKEKGKFDIIAYPNGVQTIINIYNFS